MAGKLNVGRLSKAELEYQLTIRGVTEESTVEIMRSTLRGLLKLEKSSSFFMPKYPFTFSQDKISIETGLAEIKSLMDSFVSTPSSSEFAKVTTKITHYITRTNNSTPADENEKDLKSRLLVQLVSLSSQLEVKAKHYARASSTLNAAQSSVELEKSDEDDSADDDPTIPVLAKVSTPTIKPVPVSKWNLTYCGNNQIISLNAFLERVEETRIARNMTYEHLFMSALDLFSDKALIWYRANRKNFQCWSELIQELREEFLPVHYDDQLLEEVKHRTQGQNESIGIYLSVMSNLFDRFTEKLSATQQLKILMKNILPFYQSQLGLVEITSVPQLQKLCRQLEVCRVNVERFVPPPNKNKVLEPDLAYAQITTNLANMDVNSCESPPTNANDRGTSRNNGRNCWNCGKSGHRSSQCRQTRTKHCYRCGQHDVTIATCPKCSKNFRPAQ